MCPLYTYQEPVYAQVFSSLYLPTHSALQQVHKRKTPLVFKEVFLMFSTTSSQHYALLDASEDLPQTLLPC